MGITPVEIIFSDHAACTESDRIVSAGSDTGTRTKNSRSCRLGEAGRSDDNAVLRTFFYLVTSAAAEAAFFRILVQPANGDAVDCPFLDDCMITDSHRILGVILRFCADGNALFLGNITGRADSNTPFCTAKIRTNRTVIPKRNGLLGIIRNLSRISDSYTLTRVLANIGIPKGGLPDGCTECRLGNTRNKTSFFETCCVGFIAECIVYVHRNITNIGYFRIKQLDFLMGSIGIGDSQFI